jgi:hypothetical protein
MQSRSLVQGTAVFGRLNPISDNIQKFFSPRLHIPLEEVIPKTGFGRNFVVPFYLAVSIDTDVVLVAESVELPQGNHFVFIDPRRRAVAESVREQKKFEWHDVPLGL